MKADAHDTSRRAFLRTSAAAATAAASSSAAARTTAAAATVVAATAPLPLAAGTPVIAGWPGGSVLAVVADPGEGGADAAHIEAERELARVLDEIHAVPRPKSLDAEPDYLARVEPLWRRIDALEELIAKTPAASLAGAAVKLRRLCNPDFGIECLIRGHEVESLNHVLAVVERTALLALTR
jgi:hypothetical protein